MGYLVVALGILVLAVAVVALREPNGHVSAAQTAQTSASSVAKDSPTHPKGSTQPKKGTSSTPSGPSSSTNPPDPKSMPLIVLNNTTIPHLAEQAAQRFEAGGWTVTHVDNYQNDILSTCAYYDPATAGAEAAAQALRAQYPTIKRVKPKFAGLPSGPVVVILTPDYSPG